MFSLVEYFTLGKLHKDIAKVMVTSAQDESISNKQTIVVSLVWDYVTLNGIDRTKLLSSLLIKINYPNLKLLRFRHQELKKKRFYENFDFWTKKNSPLQHGRAHYVKWQSVTERPFWLSEPQMTMIENFSWNTSAWNAIFLVQKKVIQFVLILRFQNSIIENSEEISCFFFSYYFLIFNIIFLK